MFDRVVQQIVLQTEGRPQSDIDPDDPNKEKLPSLTARDPDVAPLHINVSEIVQLLVKEEELTQARKRADELERENFEVQSRLAKKEQELDQRQQEKEDLETSLARMRERLEKESANHSQAVQRAQTAEMKAEDLQHRLMTEQQERARLERLVTEGSIPDDQKVAGLTGCNGAVSPPPPPPPMKAVPPPPPPMAAAPPPPPPCPGAPPPPAMAPTMGKKKHNSHGINSILCALGLQRRHHLKLRCPKRMCHNLRIRLRASIGPNCPMPKCKARSGVN